MDQNLLQNIFITTQIELKKLRFHVSDKNGKSKYHKMHICEHNETCSVLKVHGTVKETVTEDMIKVKHYQGTSGAKLLVLT